MCPTLVPPASPGHQGFPPELIRQGEPDVHVILKSICTVTVQQNFPYQYNGSIIMTRH